MARFHVACVTRRDGVAPHDRLIGLGGDSPRRWYDDVAAIIWRIESRRDSFYAIADGRVADLVVAVRDGCPILRTSLDDDTPDTLLALPDCRFGVPTR